MSNQLPLHIYIPMDRRQAMALGHSLPDACSGAALFADISGFTPLTEALAKDLGRKRGAEELTKYLNLIYTGLIDQVHGYRGSVIGFAGDAITCWFDDTTPDAAARAVACAMQLQQVMAQLGTVSTPSGQNIQLAIKVAVSAGSARRYSVGDPDIMNIDALAGDTLARLAAAEHLAERGDVVVTSEVIEAAPGVLRIKSWREDHEDHPQVAVIDGLTCDVPAQAWPDLPEGRPSDEIIRPWLLPGVYERERNSTDAFLAELRPAVALFIRFEGIDYDTDPEARAKLDAFVHNAQTVARRQEGSLLQLTIGDKGSYCYIAFGAPIAHDDDAIRAITAALELRARLAQLDYITSVQYGISVGTMRVGPYGGNSHRTFGVLGDEVNMAARLMSRAEPGQIYISQRVTDLVEDRFELKLIGPMQMKGKSEPVIVSAVIGLKDTSTRAPITLYTNPLVGRNAELAQMNALLDQAQAGHGQVFRLIGGAGIGKSHLTADFALDAVGQGWHVLLGACQSTTRDSAYMPWRQIFRALIGLNAESQSNVQDSIDQVHTFIHEKNAEWHVRLPLLGDLLGLPIPDNATTAAFEPKLRQSALFDLANEVVSMTAQESPLLIVIDDVHWIDEASAGMTVAMARAINRRPIMLLLTQRPTPKDEPVMPALDALPSATTLELSELSIDSVAELISTHLAGTAKAMALSLIQTVTQGNPFFVEEMIDALREAGHLIQMPDGEWGLSDSLFGILQSAGYITHDSGHWSLKPNVSFSIGDLGLPDSIQGAVLARIDRLAEADKLTLKVASVEGRKFEVDVLSHAHPLRPSADKLVLQIKQLEARDFALQESEFPRPAYLFKHNVTRDVAYDTLLYEQRKQLHRSVAEAVEMLSPEAVSQIGYHAFEGEDWPRAMRYQLEAGEQSRRLFANHEGIEHLRKALEAALKIEGDTRLQRQQIHQSLGEMLTTTGQYDEAFNQLLEALVLAEQFDDRDSQARACRWIAYAYEFRSDYPQALAWIERGLKVLGDRQTPFTAELYAIAGLISIRQANYDAAIDQCERAILIGQLLNAPASLAMAESARGLIDFSRSNNDSAIAHYQRAVQLYGEVENIHGQAVAYNSISSAYQSMSQWTTADENLRKAREIFNRTGDVRWEAITSNNLGEIARKQGRLDEAIRFYREARSAFELLGGSAYIMGILEMNLGATASRQGDIPEANKHLKRSLDYFNRAQARDYLPELYSHMAEVERLDGNLKEASALAHQSLALGRELKAKTEEGIALRVLGQITCQQNDAAGALTILEESINVLTEANVAYEIAVSQLVKAQVLESLPRRAAALEALSACMPVFEQLDAGMDLRMAHELRQRLT